MFSNKTIEYYLVFDLISNAHSFQLTTFTWLENVSLPNCSIIVGLYFCQTNLANLFSSPCLVEQLGSMGCAAAPRFLLPIALLHLASAALVWNTKGETGVSCIYQYGRENKIVSKYFLDICIHCYTH